MYHMKEQDKTPERQLNEVEIGNLPEKEFRIIIVKMIQELRKKNGGKDREDARNVFKKNLERIKEKTTDEQYNN